MFTITPSQMYAEISVCAQAQVTPIFIASPGVGKSAKSQQFAKDHLLHLIDVRLGQFTPEDLNGIPMKNGDKASFMPFDTFPVEGDPIPEGCDGWLILLDEITSATKPVQAAAYKLILDRMVGNHHLHKNVIIVAAGNKTTDKAVVNQMSTALQSRLIHYEVEVSHKEWLDHAIKNNFDHRVTAFISYMPNKLMDFKPDHQDKTFPCPRTWEFLSRLVHGRDVSEEIGARIAGTVGNGAAVEFITFAQEFHRLPKFHEIVQAPMTTPVPPEMSTRYATMSMLAQNFDETNLDQVLEYVGRFPTEIQILFCRSAITKIPNLHAKHKGFAGYLQKMMRYIE